MIELESYMVPIPMLHGNNGAPAPETRKAAPMSGTFFRRIQSTKMWPSGYSSITKIDGFSSKLRRAKCSDIAAVCTVNDSREQNYSDLAGVCAMACLMR